MKYHTSPPPKPAAPKVVVMKDNQITSTPRGNSSMKDTIKLTLLAIITLSTIFNSAMWVNSELRLRRMAEGMAKAADELHESWSRDFQPRFPDRD